MFFLLRNLNLKKFKTRLMKLFIIFLKKIVGERRISPCFRLKSLRHTDPHLKAKHNFCGRDLTIQTGTNLLAAEDTSILRQNKPL